MALPINPSPRINSPSLPSRPEKNRTLGSIIVIIKKKAANRIARSAAKFIIGRDKQI
jgi:hypothetical protein